ncbi:MAG: uracil-DNA glycosylase [Bacteroidales bacterium]|nr:uracil-DNA glycosylase [Bacteroidales bacterium]
MKVEIEESWKEAMADEFHKPYFSKLVDFVKSEKKSYTIFPPGPKIFSAFRYTPIYKVKVVILGQDPYHGDGQAHGLCFSVQEGVPQPPSLKNIFKELNDDLNITPPRSGNLERWAQQGVLLLNTTLTVRKGQPASHAGQGWEVFTDEVIKTISRQLTGVVFILWGNHAKHKQQLIDTTKHFILSAPHPSPFSAYSGFFGCKHFSKTNEILQINGLEAINW